MRFEWWGRLCAHAVAAACSRHKQRAPTPHFVPVLRPGPLAVCYLLFPQPIFKGPSAVEPLTPAAFKSLIEDAGKEGDKTTWLVEFYAPWSPPCIHLEPAVAELSLKYASDRLRWGRIDASRWPQLAAAQKVQVYGAQPALPTFVMYEKGKEQGRIPHLYEGE